jgi:hypothetical protein
MMREDNADDSNKVSSDHFAADATLVMTHAKDDDVSGGNFTADAKHVMSHANVDARQDADYTKS